jgi:hypothetical protein
MIFSIKNNFPLQISPLSLQCTYPSPSNEAKQSGSWQNDTLHGNVYFRLRSNILFNTIVMRRPFEGKPVKYREYFNVKFNIHLVGIFGGLIWGLGNAFNLIAVGRFCEYDDILADSDVFLSGFAKKVYFCIHV